MRGDRQGPGKCESKLAISRALYNIAKLTVAGSASVVSWVRGTVPRVGSWH